MTLVEFLLARIAEDEHLAQKATLGRWRFEPGHTEVLGNIYSEHEQRGQFAVAVDQDREARMGAIDGDDATHIIRWEPARVLAECNAKRRIITSLCETIADTERLDTDDAWFGVGPAIHAEELLQLLALPYAEHPDYAPDWVLPA